MSANINLAGTEMSIFMAMSCERILSTWIEPLKRSYDFVMFDCAPTLGIIPVNAFVTSDSVLIPVSAEYLPAYAMTCLLETIGHVRRQINPTLEASGYIIRARKRSVNGRSPHDASARTCEYLLGECKAVYHGQITLN